MSPFSDRRLILGGALALLLGLAFAYGLVMRAPRPSGPPPASQGGLVVEPSREEPGLDPARALRCFVGGKLIGTMTLADCARKNGVATNALDLGVEAMIDLGATGMGLGKALGIGLGGEAERTDERG